MKFKRKKLDERELFEMYKIEHYLFWLVFWGLFLSVMIQGVILNTGFKQISGEWIILMVTAVVSLFLYIKGGHYDYWTKPGKKSYLIYSLVFSIIFDIVYVITLYMQDDALKLKWLLAIALILFVFLFTIMYIILAVMGELVKRRRKKLEQRFEEECEE